MQEENEYKILDEKKMTYCKDVVTKMRLWVIKKKIMKLARYLIDNNIIIRDQEIFRVIDDNYNRFVGQDKNLHLSLILHNGSYNK